MKYIMNKPKSKGPTGVLISMVEFTKCFHSLSPNPLVGWKMFDHLYNHSLNPILKIKWMKNKWVNFIQFMDERLFSWMKIWKINKTKDCWTQAYALSLKLTFKPHKVGKFLAYFGVLGQWRTPLLATLWW